MRRRAFIVAIGSACLCGGKILAQQPDRLRRIAILTGTEELAGRSMVLAFTDGMQQLGWSEGRNLEIRFLPGEGRAETIRRNAAEAAAWRPDVIVASGAAVVPVIQVARSTPIVFVSILDPVGTGIVDNLARPGGNVTGFMNFEYVMGGKWLELLKEIAPGIKRVAIVRDANATSGVGQFAAIQSTAPSLGIEIMAIGISETADIGSPIASFARAGSGGMIVTLSAITLVHRAKIAQLAAEHKLPAVYSARDYVVSGGLVSYGADFADQFRRSASYVDRILKGAKAGDLPVQAPVKYQLAINMKAARALGLSVSSALLGRADEVIE
jgi:ABC-type uncharacterized transport system substrate-binding protein